MAAPKGNNYNKKWKTAEERKKACARFCEHLRKGLSWQHYPDADENTIYAYMKEFPDDFRTEDIKSAEREGLLLLEKAGVSGALGERKIDTKAWQFIMMNRANWSLSKKEDITSGGEKLSYTWGGFSGKDDSKPKGGKKKGK